MTEPDVEAVRREAKMTHDWHRLMESLPAAELARSIREQPGYAEDLARAEAEIAAGQTMNLAELTISLGLSDDPPITYRAGPCGECLDGQCDDCPMCHRFASEPGAVPHDAIWYGFGMGHEQPPDERLGHELGQSEP